VKGSASSRSQTGKRGYYKEPDVRYGRPRTRIRKEAPPEFSLSQEDELTQKLDARGFLNALVKLDVWAEHIRENPDWEKRQIYPGFETADDFQRFLVRPDPVTIIEDDETAKHALSLDMVLIGVDPNVSDLEVRLRKVAKEIREKHPLPMARRGRPRKSGDIDGVSDTDVRAWRNHRVLALRKLEHKGYNLSDDRKQLAWWLFPEVKDQVKRGHKLDKAVELLEQLCVAIRVIDAQTRG
jgi:hypothetical protein